MGISLGRKIGFEIRFVIRGKGEKFLAFFIFGLVEIGFSKFIYVRQSCLVVRALAARGGRRRSTLSREDAG